MPRPGRTSLARRAGPVGLLLALLGGCRAPALPDSTAPEELRTIGRPVEAAAYGLGPGDLVHVTLLGHPELSSPPAGTRVDVEGRLPLPLIGAVEVAGLLPSEAQERVRAGFARFVIEPDVTLGVLEHGARRVYVGGEVAAPGAYPLDRPLNALQALSLAGPFQVGADRRNVCLLRAVDGFVEVHVFDAARPDGRALVPVRPDDFLFVRQTGGGTFREQALPYLQGLLPVISSFVNLGLVADAIDD